MSHSASRRGFLNASAMSVAAGLVANASPAHSAEPFADAPAIQNMIEEWTDALAQQNFPLWITYWTDDAVLMPPGHPRVLGLEAIDAYGRTDFPRTDAFSFSDWRIEGQGDLAVVTNNIEWDDQTLKQVVVLRRVAGQWKVHIVMFNAGVKP
jgi:ketosteroid isomerase-like protein